MSSFSSSRGAITTQSMMAIGITVIVASASMLYIVQYKRKYKSKRAGDDIRNDNKNDTSITDDDESSFYKQLGISEENLPTHIQREIYKERQRKKKAAMISMKKPMYDNIYMLDQHKEILCTISLKKARWYIKKGIAEWSSFKEDANYHTIEGDEEACIRLLFQHNRTNKLGSTEEEYLCSEKQNICVACGDDGYHIRHYIVPYSYRSLLPEQYKSHMSHDIVILCPDCHVDCERHSKRHMKQMEHTLRMQLGPEYNVPPVIEDSYLGHVRSCAIALAKWRDKMPIDKVDRYNVVVREYLASLCNNEEDKTAILNGDNELSKSQLQKACSVNYRVKNPSYIPGSDIVVKSLNGDADTIEQFIIDWRNHFLDTVHPQHMPTGWRVDNPVACGLRSDENGGGVDAAKS